MQTQNRQRYCNCYSGLYGVNASPLHISSRHILSLRYVQMSVADPFTYLPDTSCHYATSRCQWRIRSHIFQTHPLITLRPYISGGSVHISSRHILSLCHVQISVADPFTYLPDTYSHYTTSRSQWRIRSHIFQTHPVIMPRPDISGGSVRISSRHILSLHYVQISVADPFTYLPGKSCHYATSICQWRIRSHIFQTHPVITLRPDLSGGSVHISSRHTLSLRYVHMSVADPFTSSRHILSLCHVQISVADPFTYLPDTSSHYTTSRSQWRIRLHIYQTSSHYATSRSQ
jgi:hypothetical protein